MSKLEDLYDRKNKLLNEIAVAKLSTHVDSGDVVKMFLRLDSDLKNFQHPFLDEIVKEIRIFLDTKELEALNHLLKNYCNTPLDIKILNNELKILLREIEELESKKNFNSLKGFL